MTIPPHIGIYCDLGIDKGAGHFIRCVALGSALSQQGATVTIGANFHGLSWAEQQARNCGLKPTQLDSIETIPHFASDMDILIVDSYSDEINAPLKGISIPLVVIDDLGRRPLPAQLVINQCLFAEEIDYTLWGAPRTLRGPNYALLRPEFLAAKPTHYRSRDVETNPRVLLMLGGTDPHQATPRLAERALAELTPCQLTVVAQSPQVRHHLESIVVPENSVLTIAEQAEAIEKLMLASDLVISASGITILELCCLGSPMALVTIVENQEQNYKESIRRNIAAGLGEVQDALAGNAHQWSVLRDNMAMNQRGENAWNTVDGRGAARAASSLLKFLAHT